MAVTTSVRAQQRVIDQLPREVLEVAQTLRRLKQPGDRVLARKGHIAYHGGVMPLAFPFTDSLATLARYAREARARWLFFSWPEAETRPRLQYLLDTTAVVPGLTVRAATRPRPAVLYEIGPEFGRSPAWLSNDTLVAWHFIRTQLMIRGNDQQLLLELGEVGSMLGRLDETRGALELALRRDPKNVRAAILLGNIMMSLNDPASARLLYQHATELDPGSAEARIGLGWVSLSEGKEAEAAALWRPVISFSGSTNTLERMMTLYRSLGDRAAEAEAAAALTRVRGSK
jgi:tetratricopeptide (TPR) repeat protein